MKFDDTPSKEEREDFWLDLGPASAYEGLDCCETARRDGDASPDGLAHGFEGAEGPEDLVPPPDDDPDGEPVPHLQPRRCAAHRPIKTRESHTKIKFTFRNKR